jgi:hypothetical protein
MFGLSTLSGFGVVGHRNDSAGGIANLPFDHFHERG